MMRSILILAMLALFLAAGCHKRKYPPEKVQLEEEKIYFTGYSGGEQIVLKVGTDGYYCYSSYAQRADSIYMFRGELRKFDCATCTQALNLELSDNKRRSPGSATEVDSAFRAGSRKFIPGVANIHTLRFIPKSNKQISFVRWNSGNGMSSQDPQLDFEFLQPGIQTVSLTIKTTSNCESVIVNKVYVEKENGIFACAISCTPLIKNNSQFTVSTIGGKGPFKYTWNFGDGGTSSGSAPQHDYKYAGSYPVKLVIEDAAGKVCESNYVHVAGNDLSSCSLSMSVADIGSRNAVLGGVKIQWTDKSNTVFSSDNIEQPQGSYFEILSSQNFDPNEKGESGRLLTMRFNVLISDGTRQQWLKSENAAMAVSYK